MHPRLDVREWGLREREHDLHEPTGVLHHGRRNVQRWQLHLPAQRGRHALWQRAVWALRRLRDLWWLSRQTRVPERILLWPIWCNLRLGQRLLPVRRLRLQLAAACLLPIGHWLTG